MLLCNSGSSDLQTSLKLILLIMKKYPEDKKIQRKWSACLYEAFKDDKEIPDFVTINVQKEIVSTVISGLFYHKDNPYVVRKGLFGLFAFFQNHLKPWLSGCERLIQILLNIMSKSDRNELGLERIAICFLDDMSSRVETSQRLLIGDLGAIQQLLKIIENKLMTKRVIKF